MYLLIITSFQPSNPQKKKNHKTGIHTTIALGKETIFWHKKGELLEDIQN